LFVAAPVNAPLTWPKSSDSRSVSGSAAQLMATKDPRERFGYQLPAVLPTTVVIDPDGNVAATLVGPQTESTLLAVMGVSAAPT